MRVLLIEGSPRQSMRVLLKAVHACVIEGSPCVCY